MYVLVPSGADSNYVKPEEKSLTTTTSVRKPYENWSKAASPQPHADTVSTDIRLDLSDRGTRRKL